jgi:hypothetical protein
MVMFVCVCTHACMCGVIFTLKAHLHSDLLWKCVAFKALRPRQDPLHPLERGAVWYREDVTSRRALPSEGQGLGPNLNLSEETWPSNDKMKSKTLNGLVISSAMKVTCVGVCKFPNLFCYRYTSVLFLKQAISYLPISVVYLRTWAGCTVYDHICRKEIWQ